MNEFMELVTNYENLLIQKGILGGVFGFLHVDIYTDWSGSISHDDTNIYISFGSKEQAITKLKELIAEG